MTTDFSRHFSERARQMKASDVRELLKLLQMPDMISFAGGLPSAETFPVEIIKDIVKDVLERNGDQILQYGITEGYAPLRESIASRMASKGMDVTTDNILVVSGSQQVIDLAGKVFINPKDTIVVSAPTYLAALTGFNTYQASYEAIPIDDQNMRMDIFEERMKKLAGEGNHPKLVYVLPNFQNPSGVTMPTRNRKRLVDMASEYDFVILEDDPYGELRYVGDHLPALKTFDDEGRVIFTSTFSKVLAPGLRVGWAVADPGILKKMIIAKQSTDVCTSVLGQAIAHEYMVRKHMDRQIEHIKKVYGEKLRLMLDAMHEFVPDSIRWTKPEGGMFLWATLPDGMQSPDLLEKALKRKIAFVSGKAFFPNPSDGFSTMRLNFTYPSNEKITEGIRRLGEVIHGELGHR
ncbi:MAG: PLP-dependent aminotransferase family protein [Methanomassiliicoccus sp.]|nr:MAG: PLP-dependent aminotransferase family protein [Methanomassiliicoccus sp.]